MKLITDKKGAGKFERGKKTSHWIDSLAFQAVALPPFIETECGYWRLNEGAPEAKRAWDSDKKLTENCKEKEKEIRNWDKKMLWRKKESEK